MLKGYFERGIVALIVFFGLSSFVYSQEDMRTGEPAFVEGEGEVSPEQPEMIQLLGGQRDFQVWKDITFTRNSFDEDIQDVLKAVARVNNTPITFGDGLTDTITMEFRDMPLRNAFKFLIDRYGLAYYWDADSIHVYKPDISKTKDVLIQLEKLELDEVKSALNRFGLLKKEVKIVFDAPTNTILLTGTDREIKNIQDVIAVLETAKEKKVEVPRQVRFFPLKYAKVVDTEMDVGGDTVRIIGIKTILEKILPLQKVFEFGRDRGADTSRQAVSTGSNKTLWKGQRETAPNLRSSKSRTVESVQTLMREEIGATMAVDVRMNRIIIRDYPEKLDRYEAIIKELDKPTKMVKIDVIIVEAKDGFAREFGVSYAGNYNKDDINTSFGTSTTATGAYDEYTGGSAVPDSAALVPILGTVGGEDVSSGLAGTFFYSGDYTSLTGALQATESKGVSKTINKSSIVTMDNIKAIMESSQTVTYKLEGTGTDADVASESIEAGIKLTVTPHIIMEGIKGKDMIEMIVVAERSSFDEPTSPDGIPDKFSYDLTTQAVIGDRGTIAVGGLFDSTYAISEVGVPCLMDVAILGHLFKTTSTKHPKQNIVFFLTPEVIKLEGIPYEDPLIGEKIKGYQEELHRIDPDKHDNLIEKYQKR